LLTGERPAGTDLPSDLNRQVPPWLDQVFKRSYARLDKRFTTAKEFMQALSHAEPPPIPQDFRGSVGAGGGRVVTTGRGHTVTLDGRTYTEVASLVAAGRKIEAIRVVREATRLGLAEAKDLVEWPANFGPSVHAAIAPPPPILQPHAAVQGRTMCPHCREMTSSEDNFCMHCGVQLVSHVRRCNKCGAYPDPRDRFCILCGEEMAGAGV
jgi:hypothetical protein